MKINLDEAKTNLSEKTPVKARPMRPGLSLALIPPSMLPPNISRAPYPTHAHAQYLPACPVPILPGTRSPQRLPARLRPPTAAPSPLNPHRNPPSLQRPGTPYTYAKITKGVFKSLKDCGMIISDIYLCRFARITEEKEAFNKNEHTPIEHFGDLGARVPRAGDN